MKSYTDREKKDLINKLRSSTSKTDVIRMEILFPDQVTEKQNIVLDTINRERLIYRTAVENIDIPLKALTSILNLGRTPPIAVNRIREKIKGLRAYSVLDLVVIQIIEMMVREGIDVSSIEHDKKLKTRIQNCSKSELIKNACSKCPDERSAKNLEQLDYQIQYYRNIVTNLDMTIAELAYLLTLGKVTKSRYNSICDKFHGIRAYSVLDLVVARLLQVCHQQGIFLLDIKYNEQGRLVHP